jgi:hypothetical protein
MMRKSNNATSKSKKEQRKQRKHKSKRGQLNNTSTIVGKNSQVMQA